MSNFLVTLFLQLLLKRSAEIVLISFEDVMQLLGNNITDDAMRALGITMAYSHVYSLSEDQMGTRPFARFCESRISSFLEGLKFWLKFMQGNYSKRFPLLRAPAIVKTKS